MNDVDRDNGGCSAVLSFRGTTDRRQISKKEDSGDMKQRSVNSRVVTAVFVLGGLALLAGCCEREAITQEEETAAFTFD